MAFESISITGSLFGTSSRALSGSHILTGSSFTFPFTGSADIIGSLFLNNQPVVPTEFSNMNTQDNGGLAINTDLRLGGASSIGSGISNNGTGFTLQAGKVYYLEAQVTQTWLAATGELVYEWVDSSNVAVGIARSQGYITSFRSNVNAMSSSLATAIVAPTTNQFVKLRVTSGSGTMNMGWNGIVGRVQRIG